MKKIKIFALSGCIYFGLVYIYIFEAMCNLYICMHVLDSFANCFAYKDINR